MSSKSSRRMWTDKLSGNGKIMPAKKCGKSSSVIVSRGLHEVILGVDPSLRGTGVAVVDFSAQTQKLLFSKRITCQQKLSFFDCIKKIFYEISEILEKYDIKSAAIEQTIYVQNYRTSHILGAVKGAIIAAITNKNLPITEYAPLRIKQSVTGLGRASKEQISQMVCKFLNINHEISFDESDAIAAAFCHAWTFKKQ